MILKSNLNLIPFEFEHRPVRVVMQQGRPWFVVLDACRILGIRNSRDAFKRLHEDEKGVASTDTLGGNQALQICSEPGLYRLIFASRKAEAEAFKRWVFHEVLPAIARTGRYGGEAEAAQQVELARWELGRARARRRLTHLLQELEAEPEPGMDYASLSEWFAQQGWAPLTPSEKARLSHDVKKHCLAHGFGWVTRWGQGHLHPTRLWPVPVLVVAAARERARVALEQEALALEEAQ